MPARSGGEIIRIWLVDDSANYRDLLAELLDDEPDFDCQRTFPSAEAVIEALSAQSAPDVILLDVRMPGMGGLNAIRPIKSLSARTRVLMLTTFYDSHAKEEALRDGASDLLLKSYRVEEIVDRIRESRFKMVAGAAGPRADDPLDPAASWPKRRALEATHGSLADHGNLAPRPEPGPSGRAVAYSEPPLMRGVTFLRALLEHAIARLAAGRSSSPEPGVK